MERKMKQGIRTLLVATLLLAVGITSIPLYTRAEEVTKENITVSDRMTPSGIAYEDIAGEIEKLASESQFASFETIVFEGNERLYTGYFGYADRENQLAADENTVYEWGSVSKTLIWVSAMQLYEQGKLDLDRDIRDYLPEGFLKKLKYDEPITMLDLMNHQAGWQENTYTIQVNDEENIMSLGEALQYSEPPQVYHPGEITSYSNWGASLAGYVVECVSGMDYLEYVQKNIFEPLGMEHTALAPDHRDNAWVREKRELLKSYQITAVTEEQYFDKTLGQNMWYINLYPAGAATGTIDDLATYAQALTEENCVLFQKPETRELLFTPSSYMDEENQTIPRNYHGFWASYFNVDMIFHNGGTNAGTSDMVFDPETKIGAVILANQPGETIINTKLPELLFGSIMNNPIVENRPISVREDVSGAYFQTRSVGKGILSIVPHISVMPFSQVSEDEYSILGAMSFTRIGDRIYIMNQMGSQSINTTGEDSKGNLVIHTTAMDMVKDPSSYLKLGMILLYFVLAVIGLILLIIKLIQILIKKRKVFIGSRWFSVAQLERVISAAAIAMMIGTYATNMGLTHTQGICYGILQTICLLVYLAAVVLSIVGMVKKIPEGSDKKKAPLYKYIFACVVNAFSVAFILIFELCCFWI